MSEKAALRIFPLESHIISENKYYGLILFLKIVIISSEGHTGF